MSWASFPTPVLEDCFVTAELILEDSNAEDLLPEKNTLVTRWPPQSCTH